MRCRFIKKKITVFISIILGLLVWLLANLLLPKIQETVGKTMMTVQSGKYNRKPNLFLLRSSWLLVSSGGRFWWSDSRSDEHVRSVINWVICIGPTICQSLLCPWAFFWLWELPPDFHWSHTNGFPVQFWLLLSNIQLHSIVLYASVSIHVHFMLKWSERFPQSAVVCFWCTGVPWLCTVTSQHAKVKGQRADSFVSVIIILGELLMLR